MSEKPTELPLPLTAIAALHEGRKIEAIKLTRIEHNIGLKEAHDAVEQYLLMHPLPGSRPGATVSAPSARWGWLALIAVVVLVWLWRSQG